MKSFGGPNKNDNHCLKQTSENLRLCIRRSIAAAFWTQVHRQGDVCARQAHLVGHVRAGIKRFESILVVAKESVIVNSKSLTYLQIFGSKDILPEDKTSISIQLAKHA